MSEALSPNETFGHVNCRVSGQERMRMMEKEKERKKMFGRFENGEEGEVAAKVKVEVSGIAEKKKRGD